MLGFINTFRNYYNDIGLRQKLLYSHVLLVLVPTIIIGIFFYNTVISIVVKDTIQTEEELSIQTAKALEDELNRIFSSSMAIEKCQILDDISKVSQARATKEERINKEDPISSKLNELNNVMESIFENEVITNIKIYCDSNHLRKLGILDEKNSEIFVSKERILSTYWHGIFSSTDTKSILCPELYLSPSEIKSYGKLAYIRQPFNQKDIYIAIYFSDEKIDEILSRSSTVRDSVTYVINLRDALVATSNSTLSGVHIMPSKEIINNVSNINKFSTHMFMGEKLYMGYHDLSNTDWQMVTVLNADSLNRKGIKLIIQFLAIYIIFIILALILSLCISNSIVARIKNIISTMKKVHTGRPVLIEYDTYDLDEIGQLIQSYNYMTSQINILMDNQDKQAKEMQLSEFKALQSQINPHFLYNSMEMIRWLSEAGRKEEVTRAISSLSRFYKLTLSKKNNITLIEQELEHVSTYIDIQNMRYDNSIEFIIDLPFEILEYYIPKLTFQPIVENAINHGIFMKEERAGVILISGWKEEKDIVFIINDNGVGISQEKISGIFDSNKQSKNNKGSNIGVYNTHHRLQLLYGDKYGLEYSSTLGIGTEVKIRIPIIYEEKDKINRS